MTAMGPTPAAPPSAADAFYDARRDVYYTKPVLRGWLHLLWFGASLVGGTLLLARAHGATRIAATAVYAASVSALFGVSALYHRGNWNAAWRRRLQRLDHAMIFFLIAGTATPAFLLAVRGGFGLACLIVTWSLTLTATTAPGMGLVNSASPLCSSSSRTGASRTSSSTGLAYRVSRSNCTASPSGRRAAPRMTTRFRMPGSTESLSTR